MKKKNLLQRAIIIGVVTVVGIYIVIGPHGRRPHFKDFTWSGIKATLAQKIATDAKPSDLIVLAPWQYAISFQRYYHGSTPQITLPSISDLRASWRSVQGQRHSRRGGKESRSERSNRMVVFFFRKHRFLDVERGDTSRARRIGD